MVSLHQCYHAFAEKKKNKGKKQAKSLLSLFSLNERFSNKKRVGSPPTSDDDQRVEVEQWYCRNLWKKQQLGGWKEFLLRQRDFVLGVVVKKKRKQKQSQRSCQHHHSSIAINPLLRHLDSRVNLPVSRSKRKSRTNHNQHL